MAGKGLKVVNRASAGEILLSIVRGNHTTDEIRKDLGREWTTVLRQLNPMVEEKWIERHDKQYYLNNNRLLDYWAKEFKLNRKTLKQHYLTWLQIFANSGLKTTINSLGVYFKINFDVLGGVAKGKDRGKLLSKKYPIKG